MMPALLRTGGSAPACPQGACATRLADEEVWLLPQRALYWPRGEVLFVADFHLGKVAAFREAGLALPAGTTSRAADRLTACLTATGARCIVFLGDFLHSRAARAPRTLARFAAWRMHHASVTMMLVRGNHDEHAGDPPPEWNIRCIDEGEPMAPFILAHHPGAWVGGYALSGHLHPAVRLAGQGDALTLPCFWLRPDHAVLPSFGEFTGSATVRPVRADRCYVVAGDRVLAV